MLKSKLNYLLIISLILVSTTLSYAEEESGYYTKKLTLQASLDFPNGSFGNYYKMGYGLNGAAEFYFFDDYPDLSLTGALSLAEWAGKSNDTQGPNVQDTKYDSFSIKIGAYYYIFRIDAIDIYAGLLFGFHFLKATNPYYQGSSTTTNYGGDNSESKFGYSPLIGATYSLDKKYGINLTLRYNDVTHLTYLNFKPTHLSIYAGISMFLE